VVVGSVAVVVFAITRSQHMIQIPNAEIVDSSHLGIYHMYLIDVCQQPRMCISKRGHSRNSLVWYGTMVSIVSARHQANLARCAETVAKVSYFRVR
jgi:hypothetical protein